MGKQITHKRKSFEEVIGECLNFYTSIFPNTTPESALLKAKEELEEIYTEMIAKTNHHDKLMEFADVLGCIFDSAYRSGFTIYDLTKVLEAKLEINKKRKWIENPDNTYSHALDDQPELNTGEND